MRLAGCRCFAPSPASKLAGVAAAARKSRLAGNLVNLPARLAGDGECEVRRNLTAGGPSIVSCGTSHARRVAIDNSVGPVGGGLPGRLTPEREGQQSLGGRRTAMSSVNRLGVGHARAGATDQDISCGVFQRCRTRSAPPDYGWLSSKARRHTNVGQAERPPTGGSPATRGKRVEQREPLHRLDAR
jgi:hypothetical protein